MKMKTLRIATSDQVYWIAIAIEVCSDSRFQIKMAFLKKDLIT